MSYISFHFLAVTLCLFFFYYILPRKFQPFLLLIGNLYFYYRNSGKMLILLFATALVSYLFGILLGSQNLRFKKIVLLLSILCILFPLFLLKYSGFAFKLLNISFTHSFIIPMGISFYTLQLIGYLVDVYRSNQNPEKNFFRFFLFVSFFPQILQGPIPRFGYLSKTLFKEHAFDENGFSLGIQKILWGLFFKFMIASKSAVFVDGIFDSIENFSGSFYLIAGILYSFQLYADFLSCVLLSQGISLLFGVKLGENFAQPYFAVSIKDFWHRWHISLSNWLRDYVYIPLGGSRRGKIRTDMNLLLTFLVSGLWHGAGLKYIFWGMIHGFYQIMGKYTLPLRNRLYSLYKPINKLRPLIQKLCTFFFVMLAWIIFRANSLSDGLHAFYAIIFDFRTADLFNKKMFFQNISLAEFVLLLFCILFLLFWDFLSENNRNLINIIIHKRSSARIVYSVLLLLVIVIFGTYGYGYDAGTFIYGGF